MVKEIKRGDIFITDLPFVGGSVQTGIRPCVVVQNNTGNHFSPTTMVVPLTTQDKHPIATHFDITLGSGVRNTVLCEQIITVNKTALKYRIDKLSSKDILKLNEKLGISISV